MLSFLPQKKVNLHNVVISSTSLVLRSVAIADAQCIFDLFTPSITRYMVPTSPKTLQDTVDYLGAVYENMKNHRECILAICRPDHQFCGLVGLHGRANHRFPELGIWIGAPFQGQGYGKKAIGALMAWAETHFRIEGYRYPVDRKNFPSRAIPEHFGGKVIEEKIVTTMDPHRLLDEVIYEIPRQKEENNAVV